MVSSLRHDPAAPAIRHGSSTWPSSAPSTLRHSSSASSPTSRSVCAGGLRTSAAATARGSGHRPNVRHLGRSVALQELASRGLNLVLVVLNASNLREVSDTIVSRHAVQTRTVVFDLSLVL